MCSQPLSARLRIRKPERNTDFYVGIAFFLGKSTGYFSRLKCKIDTRHLKILRGWLSMGWIKNRENTEGCWIIKNKDLALL